MPEITVGLAHTVTTTVDAANVASAVGSGSVEVFATPAMIAQMEKAAAACIAPQLEAGQTSVGTSINVGHSAATPLGMRVSTTATVTAVEGRVIQFEVAAQDEAGEIGSGSHTRVVVEEGRFMQRVAARGK